MCEPVCGAIQPSKMIKGTKTVPRKWSPSPSCIEPNQLGSGHSWYWSLSFNPKFWRLLWLLARVTLLVLLSVSMTVLHGCCMPTKLNRGEAVKIRSCSLVGVRSVPTCLLFLFASPQQQDVHVETTNQRVIFPTKLRFRQNNWGYDCKGLAQMVSRVIIGLSAGFLVDVSVIKSITGKLWHNG